MTPLLAAWLRHRQVARASAVVLIAVLLAGPVLARQISTDRSRPPRIERADAESYRACRAQDTAASCDEQLGRGAPHPSDEFGVLRARDLAGGHRHLLAPLAVLAALAAGVSGSVASGDAIDGVAAHLVVSRRSPRRALRGYLLAAGAGALAWFLLAAAGVVAMAVVLVAVVGVGPTMTWAVGTAVVVLVGRLAITAAALGAGTAALGLALPGSSVPAAAAVVAPLAAELALLAGTSSSAQLLPFGSWAVLAVGRGALSPDPAPAWIATAIPVVAWLLVPVAALALVEIVVRWRPLP